MTATASTNAKTPKTAKFDPPVHNWKQNVWENKKLTIILFILHMVSVPAILVSGIYYVYTGRGDETVQAFEIIAVCTTALAGFLGIFPAVSSFACLHDKTVVDMRLSLPMTATQRFFSNFLSGLFTYIAPFLTAQVFSLLLTGYGLLFQEGKTFYHKYFDYNLQMTNTKPFLCDIYSQTAPMLLKAILCGVLVMTMLYTVTVLITVCCGSKFESIAHTILINILLPGTIVAVAYSIYHDLYGIDSGTTAERIIMFTSVAGGILATVDWVTKGELFYGEVISNYGVWVLVYILVIAAIGALAFFLYRKRRAEQVSKPFVFKLVYYIIITCAVLCIVALLIGEGADLVPTIVITAIIYMIFEVVTNRGFKRFWLSIIKYAATFIASVAFIGIGMHTDGFGAVYTVPAAATVMSVDLDYGGFYNDFPLAVSGYNYYDSTSDYYIRRNTSLRIDDSDNIKAVVNAHKAIVDHYRKYKDYKETYEDDDIYYSLSLTSTYAENGALKITYHLAGGGTLTRQYDGYCAEGAEILSRIDLSDEFRTQMAERYGRMIRGIPDAYAYQLENNQDSDWKKTHSNKDCVAHAYNSLVPQDMDILPQIRIETLVNRGFYDQLAEAYSKDIMAIDEDNYYHSRYSNVWTVNLTGSMYASNVYITVPESYVNTVELLDYFGFGLEHIETVDSERILKRLYASSGDSMTMLMTESEWREQNFIPEGYNAYAGYGTNFWTKKRAEVYIYYFNSDLLKLIRVSQPRNIVPQNGYIISVYNYSAAIPAEYTGIAANVPRSGYDREAEKLCHEAVFGASNRYYYDDTIATD